MTALLRQVRLQPEAVSVREARQYVGEVLQEAGRTEWEDDACLAVTEIVANVVLHAHTPCDLTVEVTSDHVRVSVHDFSPHLPAPRHFSEYATTGRGLSLVGRLSADFGIESLGPDGKVVWFVVDGTAVEDEDVDPAEEWDLTGLLDDDEDEAPELAASSTAVLARVPMALWLAGLEYQAAVLRELYLVTAGTACPRDEPDVDLPAAECVMRLFTEATDRALERAAGEPSLPQLEALPHGHPSVLPDTPAVLDIEVVSGALPSGAVGAFQDALDLGQRLAREGRLLVRPALDELTALRDWACDQVVAQPRGVDATAWDVSPAHRTLTDDSGYERPDWDDTIVRTSLRAVVAADDTNRLVAVSPAAAELLAATVDELVGLRITAIIPHRLREQHVAGFTRHLATGMGRVIGVTLELPVLRLDGTEVVRRFMIDQVRAGDGRQIYLAWLDPLPEL